MERKFIRTIDEQAVEAGEWMRKNGKVLIAAEVGAVALGYRSVPLTSEEVSDISSNPNQLAVLACISRIHVDSLKTVANQSAYTGRVLRCFEESSQTIHTVYMNPDLNKELRNVGVDHRGREHHFLSEMVRDRSKTILSAADLVGGKDRFAMHVKGEHLLSEAYNNLSDSHPIKPLIGIELQLSALSRGADISTNLLMTDFEKLVEQDVDKNPHRVATVASWLIAWGTYKDLSPLRVNGSLVLSGLIRRYPEWSSMSDKELRKIEKKEYRRDILGVQRFFYNKRIDTLISNLIDS